MTINAVDTHCHPQMPQYDVDRDEVIRRALDAGIAMVCVGVDLATSRQAVDLASRYDGVYASVGLHPNDNLDEVYDQGAYREVADHPKVVAIGEVGLDYYRTTEPAKRVFQRERFELQLSLARALGKPIIVHCREAHSDMLDILSSTALKGDAQQGVIHSFTGSREEALHYISLGFYIGLNGILTFTRQYDEAVAALPLDRMLLETDAPYLSPVPYRGKKNEPVYILETAKLVAAVKEVSLEELLTVTVNNSKTLFNI